MRTGVAYYVGAPASGKTTLARAHAIEAQRANGWPILVIDSEGVAQLRSFQRARSVAQAVDLVWGKPRRSASFEPVTADEVAQLLAAVHRCGRVNLLVDEVHLWLSSRSAVTSPLLRLMRAHRHSQVRLFLTTQHLSGDVPQAALSCAPVLHLFRCTSPATLERLERTWGIPPELVRGLAQFEYVRHFDGFET